MKNNVFTSAMAALIAAIVSFSLLASSEVEASQLRYSTLVGPLHPAVQEAVNPFFKEIKEQTDNSLSGRVFPSGQLLNARATLSGISDGVVDAGMVIPQYNPTELPHVLWLANMANIGTNDLAIAAAINETILLKCKSCLLDYKKQNAFPLISYATTGYVLQCNKPVNKKSDLAELRVRSTGVFSSLMQSLGANPVNLASSESAQALQRGQVDCVLGPMSWLKSYGLQGSVSFINDTSLGSVRALGLMVLNRDTWLGLTDAQRTAMKKSASHALAGVMFGQIAEDEAVRKWATDNGVTISHGSQALRAALQSAPSSAADQAKRAKALGITNSADITASFKAALTKWQGIMKRVGHDRSAYEEALNQEIFSRL